MIFDVDGVLVDSYWPHYQSWQDMLAARGRHLSEAEFVTTFGRTSREIIATLFGEGRLSEEEIRQWDEEKEARYRELVASEFPAMDGAAELIEQLHADGFGIAAGSSGPPENVRLCLQSLGQQDKFQAVVTGHDVTLGKPNPEVFLKAAQRLSLPPARCVVIEDAPAGIAAANAAGAVSVGLLSTGHHRDTLQEAQKVVSSLREISPTLLRSWITRDQQRTTLP